MRTVLGSKLKMELDLMTDLCQELMTTNALMDLGRDF
jgi:hypothetical protein